MWVARSLVYLYLLAMPWVSIFTPWTGHDVARLAEVGLGAACALSLVFQPRAAVATWGKSRSIRMALSLTALAAVCSAALAPEPVWAWRELGLFVDMWAIAKVMAADGGGDPMALPSVAAVALGFYGTLQFLVANAGLMQGLPIPLDGFFLGYDNIRFFNHMATVALPLCAVAAVGGRRGWVRGVAWWALISCVALTLWSGGRAVLLAEWVAGSVILVGMGGRAAWPVVRVSLLAGGAGVLLYLVQFQGLPAWIGVERGGDWGQRLQETTSMAARWQLWTLAVEGWAHSPWLGIGPMHFAHHPNPDAAHPHNIYVQVVAEWGLWVFVGVVWLAVTAARWLWRLLKSAPPAPMPLVGVGLFWAAIAVAVDGLFSGNFVMPVSQVWMAAAAGGLVRWGVSAEAGGAGVRPAGASRWFNVGPAVVALWLLYGAASDARHLNGVLTRGESLAVVEQRHSPRFWSDGWF